SRRSSTTDTSRQGMEGLPSRFHATMTCRSCPRTPVGDVSGPYTCPGHPRLFSSLCEDVDARDERGHDDSHALPPALAQRQSALRREIPILVAPALLRRIGLDAVVALQVFAPLRAAGNGPPVDRRAVFGNVALHHRAAWRIARRQPHRRAGALVDE